MKRIIIFGSTGSIGCSTLDVVRRFPDRFKVVGLSGCQQLGRLAKQAQEFKPEVVVLGRGAGDPGSPSPIPLPLGERIKGEGVSYEVLYGAAGLKAMACLPGIDLAILAIPGSDSLLPAFWVLEQGRNLALASKEALVMAGGLLVEQAKKTNARIIPLDSEHNAVFQVLNAFPGQKVKRVVITASGGPFWRKRKRHVSVKDALAHPVWKMGRKVTIDSATMVNKALEVIEAHHLFGLPPEQIDVLVHPEVAAHGLVEFANGFTIANLSYPDMRLAIASGLFWPDPPPDNFLPKTLDLAGLGTLTFCGQARKRFPALDLAYRVLARSGTCPAVFSVANEEAVNAFLNGRLQFTDILPLIRTVVTRHKPVKTPSLTDILSAAEQTRRKMQALIEAK